MAIKCPKCHSDNSDSARFCSNCATHLVTLEHVQPSLTETLEPPAHTITSGTVLSGRYEILRQIGAGGMGEVYRAIDNSLGRPVAIKILPVVFAEDKERMARFEREARLLAVLNHPNIAAIHGLEEAEGKRFLILELAEGETLRARLERGPLPVEEALEVCRQLAEGLEAAHEKGIVHRDLKPANIMLSPDGKVKILDFGLAKAYMAETTDIDIAKSPTITAQMTEPGVILGTAAYMSPEQARSRPVDKRADIWAFGCVLYECLTGSRAFRGETVTDTLAQIIKEDPDWSKIPGEAPASIKTLLRRCLEKNPRERLHDIADARIEILGSSNEPLITGRAKPYRGPAHVALAGVAALVLFMTGVLVDRSLRRPAPLKVLRLSIPLPVGTRLTGDLQGPTRTEIAFSPDGDYLIFSASADGSELKSMLYRRAMDRADATSIPGTEGARMPFFSPDGKWIGFWANGQIFKVPSSGGIPTALCDLPILANQLSFPMGASWGPSGFIFIGTERQGLQRIPENGGQAKSITTIDFTKECSHRLPSALPDGKALVFTVMPHYWGVSARIELLILETGERRVLIENGADARYASNGRLVFVRQGKLMAVPFDTDRLELIGAAAPVVDGVMQALNVVPSTQNSAAGQYAFSESGSLAYVPGGIPADPIHTWFWVDRKGATEQFEDFSMKPIDGLRISPDGKKIAYMMPDTIWVYDVTRRSSTRITSDGFALFPVWTPDGGRLTFSWSRAGVPSIWIRAEGGGEMEQLIHNQFPQYPGSWTKDGKFLALVETNPLTHSDILVLGIEEKRLTPFLVTKSAERWPEFSPDAQWLAYTSDESGTDEVYVRRFPAGDKVAMISNEGGVAPVWGPDGRELFYWNSDYTKLMKVDVIPGQGLSVGLPSILLEVSASSTFPIRAYDIAPGGKRFLIPGRTPKISREVVQFDFVQNWFEELKRLVPAIKK